MWHEYYYNKGKGIAKNFKGNKLYVAFQNISINIWYTSYFAFDITFSSFVDQKCEIKLNLISKCRVSCNCLYMLLLISYQTSY